MQGHESFTSYVGFAGYALNASKAENTGYLENALYIWFNSSKSERPWKSSEIGKTSSRKNVNYSNLK